MKTFHALHCGKYPALYYRQHIKEILGFWYYVPSTGSMVHMRGCGQDRCRRPWWIWLVALPSAGVWETVFQKRSRQLHRTVARSGKGGWTCNICTQWETSVHSAAPQMTVLKVMEYLLTCKCFSFFFLLLFVSHLMTFVTVTGACEPGQYHALTVMEWLNVDRLSGDTIQLLRIRNPWGRCCWGGVWIER